MKNIFLLLLSCLFFTSIEAQVAPEKTNLIVITFPDSSQARDKVVKALEKEGFEIKKGAKTGSMLSTEAKTLKNCRVSLLVDFKGSDALLTGNIVVVGQGNMRIENKGKKGTPILNAWEEMDKVAKAYTGKIKYEMK